LPEGAQTVVVAGLGCQRAIRENFSINILHILVANGQISRMAGPDAPVTLTPDQIEEFNNRLSETRHNINNHLSLIIAAVELIKRKPDSAERMTATIAQQPDKIMEEMRGFSRDFERFLQINRE
jgi:hypothetical protein